MSRSPYSDSPPRSFWKRAVAEAVSDVSAGRIASAKWRLTPDTKVATAGSCFAQHISRNLSSSGVSFLDVEPPPARLDQDLHASFGYGLYSARYGNIYTVAHLTQLARESVQGVDSEVEVWESQGRFFDSKRPAVEPGGLSSPDEVIAHRAFHVGQVRRMFRDMDVFVFTLGLTEGWRSRQSGQQFGSAPGVVAGEFDASKHEFHNATYLEVMNSFLEFMDLVNNVRDSGDPVRYILTVSPVPLVATASTDNVIVANAYSKATLRAVAGDLAKKYDLIDYFPSYEMVTHPVSQGTHFESNFRGVRDSAVKMVMEQFAMAYYGVPFQELQPSSDDSRQSDGGSTDVARGEESQGVSCDDDVLDATCP